jgi:hypothetical protein
MTETQILQLILFGFGCSSFLAMNLAARLFSRFHPEDLQEIDQLPEREALVRVEEIANDGLFYETRESVGEHLHSLELQGVNVAPYDAGHVMFNLIADGDTFRDVLGFLSDLVQNGAASESSFFILTVLADLHNPFIY